MEDIQFIKIVSWEDVFDVWGKGESQLPRWIEHYKERGFNSWEEWRRDSVKDLHLEKLEWKLYKISQLKTVSEFYGGPFRAWIQKYYGNSHILQFRELARKAELQKDQNIQDLIAHFPKNSTLIGLVKDGDIIIIEGMHRCSALAVAHENGTDINAAVDIFLAEFNDDLPLLGQLTSPT